MKPRLSNSYVLAADIGGSHITAGICDIGLGVVISESLTRVDVSGKGQAEEILTSWSGALQSVLHRSEFEVIGISLAMPGPFDYENGISYIKGLNKYEAIYGMDIKNKLSDALNIKPIAIKFRNDAESTIAGEVLAGAGKTYKTVMGVTLGTGFGSAYSNNKVTTDLNLGSDRYKETIADDYLSTRWFIKRYAELTGKILTGGVKELGALGSNDEMARRVFDEFADNMAEFLQKPVRQLQPGVLILCGNIAKASTLFLPRLAKNLAPLPVALAQLGESAALIGAATSFEQQGQ